LDLILWRHAGAFEMREVENDLDRSLTAKGERQAKRVAAWLNRQLPATTRILVSPAKRAQQTAHALERKYKTLDALLPDGTVSGLLEAVRWPDAREPVLVIGHQPALGQAAAYLMCGSVQSWSIRKAGVWWLRTRKRDGAGEGAGEVVLATVRCPENL
jgi:phosphohistidine phosphatase